MSEKKNELSFEDAIKQLERIVEKLEHGDVPLEEAITYYKEGMNLSKHCHDRLKHVEAQMEQILRENGELEPFSVQEEE
ncbi:exodeoxyribonuclease VII small subunit [Sutcliffiella cohnii]|uniref:Exodeoxyribonuclease 7 small subunit n=1 Tax=Sutcliffiella cohnii TaxID=33932 RepID=A0A223KSH7_9BACI|nr:MULTISPECIES: exodeoxyribonuclease VII small subunit [Sutcliffiella]AST92445.1 exodeoxyribonuclease VII small subunit [Sutcliffiella cohnii]MED4017083.1 exodeoxyribonuclease VII small subunit [Sutcliffiella cohnii]WBL13682.1 exodeoxyribonuclease VII small subunit [Sutcliffiella sp. NC1]